MTQTSSGLPDHLQRSLLFVALANEGGYFPTAAELDAYATTEEPSGAVRMALTVTGLSKLAGLTGSPYTVTHGDPVARYLLRVGWVVQYEGGLRLSDLGAGLAAAVGRRPTVERSPRGPQGVVLKPGDDAVWTLLTREVARAGAGLLADPYFRDPHLEWLVQTTSITRVVVAKKALQGPNRGLLELELGRLADERSDLQVRVSEDLTFHDRYLQHAGGEVHLIGASINGIGTSLTTIAPAPPAAQGALGVFLADLWRDADPVTPRHGIKRVPEPEI